MSGNFAAGEFFVESLTLVNQYNESVDLTNMVSNFQLYESIFNKFVTGDVSILDGINLLKNFRMTGQEFIRIAIRQKEGTDEKSADEFSIDKTFRIYKVDNVQRPDELTQTYMFRICDPKMFTVRRKRLSQALRGRYDQILQNVLIDFCKFNREDFDGWEQTVPENKQFICPNWNIGQLIDYIVNNSSIGESAAYKNGMFFFQTLTGGFRFQSVDTMMSMEFPIEFSNTPRNALVGSEEENINAPKGLNTQILQYEKPQVFDTLQATVGGAYASTLKVYDPIRKLEEENIYDLETVMGKGEHVSGNPMLYVDDLERVLSAENLEDAQTSPKINEIGIELQPTKEPEVLIINDYHSNHVFDNATSLSEPEVFEARKLKDTGILQRRALLEVLEQHRIIATIPLRTDLSVGMIVKLNITSPEVMGTGDIEDEVNDNRYLITDLSISGSPQTKQGVCFIECVKESYAKKIETARPLDKSTPPEDAT